MKMYLLVLLASLLDSPKLWDKSARQALRMKSADLYHYCEKERNDAITRRVRKEARRAGYNVQ